MWVNKPILKKIISCIVLQSFVILRGQNFKKMYTVLQDIKLLKVLLDSMLKTQSKDKSFIADAGLKGTGFLFRFLNKLKMLGVFILLQSFHYYISVFPIFLNFHLVKVVQSRFSSQI